MEETNFPNQKSLRPKSLVKRLNGEETILVPFKTVRTIHDAKVKLLHETLERILRKHSELRGCEDMILETVKKPDRIVKGHKLELIAIKHYCQTPAGAKDMIVVYCEDKELIITAFLTSKTHKIIKRRPTIWRKPR